MPLSSSDRYKIGGVVRGAASGAALGSAFAPGIGTAVGAVIGAGISLFDTDPETERQNRRAERMASIAKYRGESLKRGTEMINKNIAGQMKNVTQGTARRFASMGRTDAESAIVPAQSNIADAGAQASERYATGVNNYYDQAEMQTDVDFSNRPIGTSLTDIVQELGVAGLQYKGAQDRIEAMKEIYGDGKDGGTPKTATDPAVKEILASQGMEGYYPGKPVEIVQPTETDNRIAVQASLNKAGMGDYRPDVGATPEIQNFYPMPAPAPPTSQFNTLPRRAFETMPDRKNWIGPGPASGWAGFDEAPPEAVAPGAVQARKKKTLTDPFTLSGPGSRGTGSIFGRH